MISEKALKAALKEENRVRYGILSADKREVVDRLINAGLVEKEVKYYGVAMELETRNFFYYEHGDQHEPLRGCITMNNFFYNEDDAITLAKMYNEVRL